MTLDSRRGTRAHRYILQVVLRDDQTSEDGERIASDLMEKLGVDKADLIAGAYTDLLNGQ